MRDLAAKLALLFSFVCFAIDAAYGQSPLNLSEDLVRLGIASANMVPNEPALDAGPLLAAGVNYAQSHQIPVVVADQGAYYFLTLQNPGGPHVSFSNTSDLTIDLQGSDLYFSHLLHPGLSVGRSTNLAFQNFTLDYQPLPSTQLQVVSIDPATYQIQFSVTPGWSDPSSFNALQNTNGWNGILSVRLFRAGQPVYNAQVMGTQAPFSGNRFTLTSFGSFSPSAAGLSLIRPGDIVVLSLAGGGPAMNVANCTGCTFRNITAYSATGDGVNVYAQSTLLERVDTIPRPGTDRLVSTFGQGFTPSGPNNIIRLSRAIRTMDDAFSFDLWVTGTVESQLSSSSLSVEGTFATTLSQGVSITNGSPVVFENPADGTIVGSAIVVSQIAPSFSPSQPYRVVFNFDRNLPGGLVGTDMYTTDPNQRGANTLMERNAVEDQAACCRGMSMWGYANSTLQGNYISRSAMTGVHVTHHLNDDDWQVPPVINLTINHNVIDRANSVITGYGPYQLGGIDILAQQSNGPPMATSPNQNITVTGNFIADPGTTAVWMGNTTGGSVSGNYFLNPNNNPSPEVQYLQGPYLPFEALITEPLVVETSSNIVSSNNTIDHGSGRLWITDTQYNELAAYAPGSVYRLNAYNLGTLPDAAITLTDGSGNTTSVTIQRTATHSIDVQIPATAGLGGAYLTLNSGSVKYFGTLFLDSQGNIPALNGCTYETSLSSTIVPGAASSVPILVVTQAGCPFQVLNTDSFVSPGAGSKGTSLVSVGFTMNPGAARTTTIEIAGQQITLTQATLPPVLPSIQAIVDSWNYTAGTAPGAWVTITGTALASGGPQTWNVSGVQKLPTTLGNVTVAFNGTLAALYYVSATQINALVPASLPPGPVQVVVQSNGLNSAAFMINGTVSLPAIYGLPVANGDSFFITSALQGTGFLVGNSAVDPRVIRAAQPGDLLDLYMIGLGATVNPSQFITDQNFAGAYPVSANVTAMIGGESAPVLFAGLTSPGLYLVRVAVPSDLKAGPQRIQVSTGSAQTSSLLMLTVSAAPPNLVQNGSFESALAGTWQSSVDGTTGVAATINRASDTAVDGVYSAEISVASAAAHTSANSPCLYCAVQFWESPVPLQKGQVYMLQFWAKADIGRTMPVNLSASGPPFQNYGLSTGVGLDGSWQRYVIYFQATATDPAARLTFYFGDRAGNTWLDNMSVQGSGQ